MVPLVSTCLESKQSYSFIFYYLLKMILQHYHKHTDTYIQRLG